jgi:hypothetical protein
MCSSTWSTTMLQAQPHPHLQSTQRMTRTKSSLPMATTTRTPPTRRDPQSLVQLQQRQHPTRCDRCTLPRRRRTPKSQTCSSMRLVPRPARTSATCLLRLVGLLVIRHSIFAHTPAKTIPIDTIAPKPVPAGRRSGAANAAQTDGNVNLGEGSQAKKGGCC